MEDGSGFIASAGTIKKEPCGFPGTYLAVNHNSIQKLDNQLKLEWNTQIGNLLPSTNASYKEQVIAHDGSGIVAVGNTFTKYGDSSSSYRIAVMSKVSWAGDSIWTRFIVADSSNEVDQYTFDIEATDDGGYILCGLANFYNESDPLLNQQLWLVKTDEYGCVVPNCQLTSSLPLKDDLNYKVSLFPNPASTKLNVYIGKLNPHRRIKMSIVSGSGQVFHSSDVVISDATYVIDIHQWPEGFYYLQIHENTLSRTSVGFVVVR